MSWIIIGLITFAIISCVCCVVACCLRNKVSKSVRFCRSLPPRVIDRELDLMRFRGWDRDILTQHVTIFLTDWVVNLPLEFSHWWQQLRFNFSKTELFIDLKAGNQKKEEKCCTGQQNYFGKQFTWLFSSRRGNKSSVDQFQLCSGEKPLKQRTIWLRKERRPWTLVMLLDNVIFSFSVCFIPSFICQCLSILTLIFPLKTVLVTAPLKEQRQECRGYWPQITFMAFSLCWQNQQRESNSYEYNSEYMPMAAVNAAKKPRIWGCIKPTCTCTSAYICCKAFSGRERAACCVSHSL